MKKIAIRFGDNDFFNTFNNVLKVLSLAHEYNPLPDNKEQLACIISAMAPVIYMTFQNRFEYNKFQYADYQKLDEDPYYTRMKQYLTVSPDRILLDKEVDDFVKSTDWDNSETFILDVSGHAPYIYSL